MHFYNANSSVNDSAYMEIVCVCCGIMSVKIDL